MSPARRHVAVAYGAGVDADAVERLLGATGPIQVTGTVPARESEAGGLDDRRIDGLVCLCTTADADLLAFIRASAALRPWLPIVVACDGDAGGTVRELLAAGADDVVAMLDGAHGSTGQQLHFVLEKVIAQRGGAVAGTQSRGEVVTVLGPKGGTGKTLTTCNLAVALAQAGRRVAVVDLDLQFGDVGLSLGLDPVHTIHDLAAAGGTIDADKLDAYLTTHASGVRTLIAPVRPDQAESVTTALVGEVLGALRLVSDVVIVDTPPGFTPAVIASIDASTSLCLVSMLDSLSLKNTRIAIDTLELMGYASDTLKLVLNRADSDVGVHPRDVEALLGRPPDILVPSSRSITRAVNDGTPIVVADPGSAAARAFGTLAASYGGPAVAPEDPVSNPVPRRRRGFTPALRTIRKAAS